MVKETRILTWDDYSESYSKVIRGSYCVVVSIPRKIRHLFGNAPTRQKVAGKTEDDFNRRQRSLTHQIYQEFDERQRRQEENQKVFLQRIKDEWGDAHDKRQDDKRNTILQKMVAAFPHVVPEDSSYNFYKQIDDDIYPEFAGSSAIKPLTENIPFSDLERLKNGMDSMARMVKNASERFTVFEVSAAKDYLEPSVRSYFEDLLVDAAKQQKCEIPNFPEPTLSDFWFEEDAEWQDYQVRPRKHEELKMSAVMDEYFAWIEKYFEQKDTKNKLKLGCKEFISYMGDLHLSKLDAPMAVGFAEAQCDQHVNRSKATIKNRNWAMNTFCQEFCIPKRYMSFNPFYGVSLKRYGTKGGKWLEYTDADLDKIFGYSWGPQELLLLQLALATGMRLGEIALLTWERVKSTNKCSFISLLDEGDEIVTAKNQGSKRRIPLHPNLKLPPKGNGRIFDYAIDGYGKATTAAGRAVNPKLKELIAHDRKTFHSFRSSFIIKLTKVGTPPNINKMITGHGVGDVNTDVYGGVSVEDRFEWIRKIDLPWMQ